jgi:hypothetical protein
MPQSLLLVCVNIGVLQLVEAEGVEPNLELVNKRFYYGSKAFGGTSCIPAYQGQCMYFLLNEHAVIFMNSSLGAMILSLHYLLCTFISVTWVSALAHPEFGLKLYI